MLTDEKLLDDPRRAVQLGLGFYSPLWPTFMAAAGAGVAFWAWAQWMRGKAESEFSPVLTGTTALSPAAPPEAVTEAAEAVAEVVAPVVETVTAGIEESAAVLGAAPVEAAPEPVAAELASVEALQDPVEVVTEPPGPEIFAAEEEAPAPKPASRKRAASAKPAPPAGRSRGAARARTGSRPGRAHTAASAPAQASGHRRQRQPVAPQGARGQGRRRTGAHRLQATWPAPPQELNRFVRGPRAR